MTELLSLEALRVLPGDVMAIEGDTCVYFLWDGDGLQYIGGSRQCSERISRHIRDRRFRSARSGATVPFTRYTLLEAQDSAVWDLENEYQRAYEPPYSSVNYRRRRY